MQADIIVVTCALQPLSEFKNDFINIKMYNLKISIIKYLNNLV